MAHAIQWLPNLEEAVSTAKKENKHVLLDFFNPL
jgi:hypothetical protein